MGQQISSGGSLRPDESLNRPGRISAPPKSAASSPSPPPECPMHASPSTSRDALAALQAQAANQMPDLPQSRSSEQLTVLEIERTISSIPRSAAVRTRMPGSPSTEGGSCPVASPTTSLMDANRNWVYPSPQQFHNALVRKGKEAPEESISMMVNIHNWLNESAWLEIRRWEENITGGELPELASFQGKPDELSPKARWHLLLGRLFPDRYNTEPPFDRHDWSIYRPKDGTLHRYIIDYYSAPEDEQGMPVFNLDVRPALDSPSAVYWRIAKWWRDKSSA